MKPTITFLFVLFLSFACFGQAENTGKYIFPEKNSEFTIVFPGKPTIQTIDAPGKSGTAAEMLKPGGWAIRAEILKLSASEMEAIKENRNADLGEILFFDALSRRLKMPVVEMETNALGRCARLKPNTTEGNNPMTYEMIYCWGTSERISVYTAAASKDYQTSGIPEFLSSLSLRSKKTHTKGVSIKSD